MPRRDIVVIGASAGGVGALQKLVGAMPPDFPGSLLVVLHLPPEYFSTLDRILDRAGPLRAMKAEDGQPVEAATVYVAPADHHLLLDHGHIRVAWGPKENRLRPSADVLFRSAAAAYGPRVAGVVLSGTLDDGTAGLIEIKAKGGVTIVQDPRDALFSDMPTSALRCVDIDFCLPVKGIGEVLRRLANGEPSEAITIPEMEEAKRAAVNGYEKPRAASHLPGPSEPDGQPSVFTCPECHGTLWAVHDGDLERYQCRVGHAYSPDALFAAQGEALEAALWAGLRALEERQAFTKRLGETAARTGRTLAAERYQERLEESIRGAEVIRHALALFIEGDPEAEESETG